MANIIYEKLKKLADDNSLTSQQVADATKAQAAAMMDIDDGYIDDKVFEVAKKAVLRELEKAKWQKALEGLKAQLVGGDRVWLTNNFPDAEFEINFRRKTATIYFEGKPFAEDID
ncbi:MAG: hypothetical protein ACYTFK_01290 [Planctomycetota bacterium]|jgi:hypothetical protein